MWSGTESAFEEVEIVLAFESVELRRGRVRGSPRMLEGSWSKEDGVDDRDGCSTPWLWCMLGWRETLASGSSAILPSLFPKEAAASEDCDGSMLLAK